MSDHAGFMTGDGTIELCQSALRQIVSFNFVIKDQLSKRRDHVPVSADDTFGHSFVGKMIRTASVTVSLGSSVK